MIYRFEFDLETMNRYKINDYFAFPLELDMSQYVEEEVDISDNNASDPLYEEKRDYLSGREYRDHYRYCLKGNL